MFLPFGRYQGQPVRDVPDDYLEWLISLPDLRDPLRHIVELEWDRRTNQTTQSETARDNQDLAPKEQPVLLRFVEDSYRRFPGRKEQGLYGLSVDMRRLKNVLRSLRKQLRREKDHGNKQGARKLCVGT